jgi:hypothetical protein
VIGRPPERLWGPLLFAPTSQLRYDQLSKNRPGVDKVRHVRRKLLWILVLTPTLTGCQPLEDLGKLVDDLLKRFTG